MTHYFCKPSSGNPSATPLVFDWDESAGTVSGPSAGEIMKCIEAGGVPSHPMPGSHAFGPEPLKSRTDMAAIIGYLHKLPAELADAYPTDDSVPAHSGHSLLTIKGMSVTALCVAQVFSEGDVGAGKNLLSVAAGFGHYGGAPIPRLFASSFINVHTPVGNRVVLNLNSQQRLALIQLKKIIFHRSSPKCRPTI